MDVFFKRLTDVEKKVEEKFGSWFFSSIFAPLLEKGKFFEKIEE